MLLARGDFRLSFSLEPDNVSFTSARLRFLFPLGRSSSRCASGVAYWILGDVFTEASIRCTVENLRVGFACEGECEGDGWHGKGGYVDVGDRSGRS